MQLTNLHVQGYRCLADVAIPLRSPMVLIGPNGAGKTALLEVLTLLRDAASERLERPWPSAAGSAISSSPAGPMRSRYVLVPRPTASRNSNMH